MNLALFFDPVSEALVNTTNEFNTFQNAFYINTNGSINWDNCDIALIGVNDYKANIGNQHSEISAPDEIRKQLYQLYKSSVGYRMCDLGNLREGESTLDTEERLREVCEFLIDSSIIPIIIGGSHNLAVGQYHAYQKFDKLVSVLMIDSCIDMISEELSSKHNNFLNRILLHEPNYLFNFTLMGYQSYITDPELLNVFEKLNFEHYRLGALRDHIEDLEPIIRQANMVSFDLGAIKIQDAPGQTHNRPFGLTGEESCRIAWYAGLSEKVNSFSINEYYPDFDIKSQTANLIATLVWYFIEGFYHRIQYEGYDSESFMKYNVSVNGSEPLLFFKHKYTEKWWLQVPKGEEYVVIPCSYNDYLTASNGDLPDRWIKMQARFI